jgi:V/A-type H+-transporting ATPase subunit I
MKKFTIITPPEYEALVLEAIGRTGIAQLKEVTGPEFDRFKAAPKKEVDYKGLSEKFHGRYQGVLEAMQIKPREFAPSLMELRGFTEDAKGKVDELIEKLGQSKSEMEGAKNGLEEEKLRLVSLQALKPEELKECIGVGVLQYKFLPQLEEHLKRFGDLTYKTFSISEEEGFIFVFGPEERKAWIESIFLVFDVRDIFEALKVGDILLVLDPKEREERMTEIQRNIEDLSKEYEKKREDLASILGMADYTDRLLYALSTEEASVLRTSIISVMQGWVPDEKLPVFKEALDKVEKEIGAQLLVSYEEPSHEDEVPTPRPTLKPKFLDPAFTLTSLRGWPTAKEINPSIISILIFSLQFGIMFGDVGQGLIFLLLGLFLSRIYKRGITSKIAVMFIPMGILSIIFGFLYGEFFLIEGVLHPLLLSPVHEMGKLFKIVLGIAVLEMSIGLVLSSINAVKEGHKWGPIGEHGAGAILFLVGLYFGGLYFLEVGNFMAIMSHWSFYMMITGLIMSAAEPLITSFSHGKPGAEVLGDVVAGLMMVFVECLANFFSFLRIGAFALAHASLAVATEALSKAMGPLIGILLMNVIAMTFEFASSSVQSLRLLYYEFMGKFFRGTGSKFVPFSIRGT